MTQSITAAAKPFLKWAGGKGQLLGAFEKFYPSELKTRKIKHYYEPFIGGGAVFFEVAQKYALQSAFLYDINEELILTYKVVQNDAPRLIELLTKMQEKYLRLNEKKRSDFFYSERQIFNKQKVTIDFDNYSEKWIRRAAQIIFLNKTCFNGLFRFNLKGEFNTPAGSYKNPKIVDQQNLLNASKILQIAKIKKADFREVETDLKEKAFVYFDPPYRPISKTSSFTSYSKTAFNDEQQIALGRLFHRLNAKGAKLMLSNSDPKNTNPGDNFFDDIYSKYHIFRIPARRVINSNAAKRNTVNEIVVTNYLGN